MNKPVDYRLEITPSLRVPEGGLDRPGGCTQDCPHCVFSDQRPVLGVRTVTDEVLEALDLTQVALRGAKNAYGDRFSNLTITSGFPSSGLPPLFKKRPLIPDLSPDYLGFGFGDLSRLTTTDLQDSHLPERLEAHVPFQFHRRPTLHVDYRLPLQGLKALEADLEKAIVLGRSLLQGSQAASYPFNPHDLSYSESTNAYPKPGDLMDPALVEGKNDQIRDLIVGLFPDDPLRRGRVMGHEPSAEVLSTINLVHRPSGVFIYGNRIVAKIANQTNPLTELMSGSIAISFFPDFVWINHSTHTTRDLTVRFTYEEYFEILKESEGDARILKQGLEKRILERRA